MKDRKPRSFKLSDQTLKDVIYNMWEMGFMPPSRKYSIGSALWIGRPDLQIHSQKRDPEDGFSVQGKKNYTYNKTIVIENVLN